MANFAEFLGWLNSILWGAPALMLIFSVGLLYAIRTRFFQVRYFTHIMKNTLGEIFSKQSVGEHGTLTPFQAVSTALSGCIGTGTISGVATAIFVGGPGAVFWMWVIAVFGMLTKCVEVTLAQYYRIQGDDGVYYGGPMYYIERGLGKRWKPLAILFALAIVFGGLGTAAFVQPFAMSSALNSAFNIPTWVTVTVAATICGIVLIRGVEGVGKFCEKVTPFMCVLYVAAGLGVLLSNFQHIPAALEMIFTYAFQPFPAMGGLAGSTVALALRQGAARGTFSNEAGLGSSAITHATARTPHPLKEGMYGAFEVFITTLVVCTMTALAILTSNIEIWQSGLKDVQLTQAAFSQVYGFAGSAVITICLMLFAFSTMIGWEVNYESAFFYIFPKRTKAVKLLIRIIWIIPGFFTIGQTPELIWTVVDVVAGLWCIPNTIALLLLSGVFMAILNDYKAKYIDKTKGISEPIGINKSIEG